MKITPVAAFGSIGAAALLAAGCATMAAPAPAARTTDVRATARECTASQLGLAYSGGQAGAGNDFGTVWVWDKSGTACALASPVRISGLNNAGRRVTRSQTLHVTGTDVLTADGSGPRDGLYFRPGEFVAMISLSAEYRDDPSSPNGLCTAHRVEPARWQITMASGAVRVVANADRAGSHSRTLSSDGGLLTCRGELNTAIPITVSTHA